MTDNTTFGEWQVVGRRAYRGVQPGESFPARIANTVAARAIARGDIILLEEFQPRPPDNYALPKGWASNAA